MGVNQKSPYASCERQRHKPGQVSLGVTRAVLCPFSGGLFVRPLAQCKVIWAFRTSNSTTHRANFQQPKQRRLHSSSNSTPIPSAGPTRRFGLNHTVCLRSLISSTVLKNRGAGSIDNEEAASKFLGSILTQRPQEELLVALRHERNVAISATRRFRGLLSTPKPR